MTDTPLSEIEATPVRRFNQNGLAIYDPILDGLRSPYEYPEDLYATSGQDSIIRPVYAIVKETGERVIWKWEWLSDEETKAYRDEVKKAMKGNRDA